MNIKYASEELRVIGCLIEKSITTPDQYPLSLNSLTNACNQKSNREPVLSLSEQEVQSAIDNLVEKNVVYQQFSTSSRVPKFLHRFCNTEFGDLQLSSQQLGVICVLFLRGPQTPGELRTRTNRLCQFANVGETEAVLDELIEHGYVVKLDREPGRRESRYQHCFSDSESASAISSAGTASEYTESDSNVNSSQAHSDSSSPANEKIAELEERILMLELEMESLKERLDNRS